MQAIHSFCFCRHFHTDQPHWSFQCVSQQGSGNAQIHFIGHLLLKTCGRNRWGITESVTVKISGYLVWSVFYRRVQHEAVAKQLWTNHRTSLWYGDTNQVIHYRKFIDLGQIIIVVIIPGPSLSINAFQVPSIGKEKLLIALLQELISIVSLQLRL